MIGFTDRPGAIPPGLRLAPYLSGAPFSDYYLFTKTIPDLNASRAGMVFTHVLILEQQVVSLIDDLDSIFALFVDQIPAERNGLEPLSLSISRTSAFANTTQPQYIVQVLTGLLSGTLPILFSGTIAAFQKTVQMIWNLPLEGFRKNIRFRASFAPSDIDGITNLTLVNIQKEFLPKWVGKNIIRGENSINEDVSSCKYPQKSDNF